MEDNIKEGENQPETRVIEYDDLENKFKSMVSDSNSLKNGHKILSEFEKFNKFHLNMLKIIVNKETSGNLRKLVCISLRIFLKKNWNDEAYISHLEKMAFLEELTKNITIFNDYFMKNYIATILGIIASKEQVHIIETFLKVVLTQLSTCEDYELIDTYLRIILSILTKSGNDIISITGNVLPVVLDVFKNSKSNQKNREKCLRIVIVLFSKLSLQDGYESDVIPKHLDSHIDNCLSLFISILLSNPKLLFDIKKLTVKALDIFVRDMPNYSAKYIFRLIEPVWTLIVLEISLYTEVTIFNQKIEYTDSEENQMEEENHVYKRGYESDDEDEKFGIEGLIFEVIDFAIDLFKRNGVQEVIHAGLCNFLLCVKGYCLMPHHSIILWKNDPNLYITEEYEDENINTIRSKTLSIIKELTKELDDDSMLLSFIKILVSEFREGLKVDNYAEAVKLDDYNLIEDYFEKMNTDGRFTLQRHEANLLILGNLSEDLLILKEKEMVDEELLKNITSFLLEVIANPTEDKNSGILVGRAIWCISKLFSLVRENTEICCNIFEAVSMALTNPKSDLSVCLVACLCLSKLCNYLKNKDFDNEFIIKDYDKLIDILKVVSEDTLIIPIETILALSKVNKPKSLHVPKHNLKLMVDIYSNFYSEPQIGSKILELIKFWCTTSEIAKLLINLFIPFAIHVFDDFFKSLKNPGSKNFEEVKKTVITEVGGDIDFKTNLEMLPNLVDIISILTKYCVEAKDKKSLEIVSMIVNILCEILVKSDDTQILLRGTAFLKIYIPTCAETIIAQKQSDLFVKVIMRFFDPKMLDSNLLYIGNVTAQYFAHINKKLELNILEANVRRLYKCRMPSIVQSLILVFSRLIILYPENIINFLIEIDIEKRPALKIMIDKWLLHQPLFRGKYYKNVSMMALMELYKLKNKVLETLSVIGYDPSHSTASFEVPAPLKILSTLVRCLQNEILQEVVKEKKTNYDDMDYGDELCNNDDLGDDRLDNLNDINDGDINENKDSKGNEGPDDTKAESDKLDVGMEDFQGLEQEEQLEMQSKLDFVKNQNKGGGGCLKDQETGSVAYVTEMMGFDYNDNENDEEDLYEDDTIYFTDIKIDFLLKDKLFEFFKNFKVTNGEYLEECVKVLPKKDRDIVKTLELL